MGTQKHYYAAENSYGSQIQKKEKGMHTERKLKTIHTLLSNINDQILNGHVSEGWLPTSNLFGDAPLTIEGAKKMNDEHDKMIKVNLDWVARLLAGEELPGFMDNDI